MNQLPVLTRGLGGAASAVLPEEHAVPLPALAAMVGGQHDVGTRVRAVGEERDDERAHVRHGLTTLQRHGRAYLPQRLALVLDLLDLGVIALGRGLLDLTAFVGLQARQQGVDVLDLPAVGQVDQAFANRAALNLAGLPGADELVRSADQWGGVAAQHGVTWYQVIRQLGHVADHALRSGVSSFDVRHVALRQRHHGLGAAPRDAQGQHLSTQTLDEVGQCVSIGPSEAVDGLAVIAHHDHAACGLEELARQGLSGTAQVLGFVQEDEVLAELDAQVLHQREEDHVIEVDDVGLLERPAVDLLRGLHHGIRFAGVVQAVDVVVVGQAVPD